MCVPSKQRWKDEFLQWNPDKYGGIQQLYLKTNSIWRPDISLQNSLGYIVCNI